MEIQLMSINNQLIGFNGVMNRCFLPPVTMHIPYLWTDNNVVRRTGHYRERMCLSLNKDRIKCQARFTTASYDLDSKTGINVEEKKVSEEIANELVLDGGFSVPDINSFGQAFRDYNAQSERQKKVEEFYKINHINQTFEFVQKMREEYGKMNRVEMSIWECCELLRASARVKEEK